VAFNSDQKFYGEEDDTDHSNADLYFSQAIFNKDMISPSPSQVFGSSLYSQQSTNSLGMGGLSMQQASRTLGNQQMSRAFGSSGIPGHITPTSTGLPSFPTNLTSSLPQQPSPNRNMLNMGTRGILGQSHVGRDIKRPVHSSLSNLSGFGLTSASRGFSSQSMMTANFSSPLSNAFPNSNPGNEPPSALDLSEFPSLNNRGRQDTGSSFSMNSMMGRPAYEYLKSVGMVKQPHNDSSEFQIHNEDFPALPGSQAQDTNNSSTNTFISAQDSNNSSTNNKQQNNQSGDSSKEISRYPGEKSLKRGIQTSPDGTVTNIPSGMVVDQFGMVGLLTFIRAAENDPNLVSLALGSDLTTLGLNLNSQENLYPTFGGPYAETPCRPQDIDFHVPTEYLINTSIRDKLSPFKLNRYGEDLLFYMFYTNGGDVLQLAAAAELYSRDWRYHKEERVWITRAPGMIPVEKASTFERGTYYFFDVQTWRKVPRDFHLDYEKLEDRPHLPPSMHHGAAAAAAALQQ